MRDDTTDEETTTPGDGDDDGPTPAELRHRLEQRLGGRPLMVYLVLFAGTAALLILLIIVWISATGDDDMETPICQNIQGDAALELIYAGQVEQINIVRDQERPQAGPALMQLDVTEGTCRKLPEGVDNRETLLLIIGAATDYNQYADQQIQMDNRVADVARELLVTSTPIPTETAVPTETPTPKPATPTAVPVPPTETPVPTETPEPTPEPTATETPPPPPTATVQPATPTVTPASPLEQPAP